MVGGSSPSGTTKTFETNRDSQNKTLLARSQEGFSLWWPLVLRRAEFYCGNGSAFEAKQSKVDGLADEAETWRDFLHRVQIFVGHVVDGEHAIILEFA
jgi:hypothetical protein